MTSADVRTEPRERKKPPTEGQRRKDVLFCPVCGHDSPVDGSWVVTAVEAQQEYRCPECDQVVAVR